MSPKPQGVQLGQCAQKFAAGSVSATTIRNPWLSHRTSEIPSLKMDHQVGTKGPSLFYWHTTNTEGGSSLSLMEKLSGPAAAPSIPPAETWIYSPNFR